MSDKFQNKYRIPLHRKPGWKYSSNGMYFITLVTQHRICNLGEIVPGNPPTMELSDFGKIVNAEWHKSFEIRDELFLETYVIMPNHMHAIVVINNENESVSEMDDAMIRDTSPSSKIPQRLPKSISSFLAGFKSAVNTEIYNYIDANNLNIPKYNRNNHFFQPNYYDHIIRNHESFHRIKNYIISNPSNWTNDKLYNR